MNDPASPKAFSFTCSDLIMQLRDKLHRMVEMFGDLFLPKVEDSVLIRYLCMILNGYLNGYYVDAVGFLVEHVFRQQPLDPRHLQYLYDEVAACASMCLAARTTLASDWIHRPPERQYTVVVQEDLQRLQIAWTA